MPNEGDRRLAEVIAASLERALQPFLTAITDLSTRTASLESRLTVLAQVTESGFRNVAGRLDALEAQSEAMDERLGAMDERLGRFVGAVTRGRTSDN